MRRPAAVLAVCLLLAGCGADTRPVPALPEALEDYPGAEITVEDTAAYGEVTVSTIRYRLSRRDGHPDTPWAVSLNLDLRFPQVSDIPKADAVNLMLLDAALRTAWADVTAANAAEEFALVEEWHREAGPRCVGLCGEADYTLLSCGGGKLSVLFFGENMYSNGVNFQEQPLTIDLETAAWVDLTAFTDFDALLSAVRSGGYEVLSGHYLPGGWDGPEMADAFADALAEQADPVYALKIYAYMPEATPGMSKVRTADGLTAYPECSSYTSRNFGMEEGALYLRAFFDDSLDGYILLKVPFGGVEKPAKTVYTDIDFFHQMTKER